MYIKFINEVSFWLLTHPIPDVNDDDHISNAHCFRVY